VKTLQAQRDARKNSPKRKGLVPQRGNAAAKNQFAHIVWRDPRLIPWQGLPARRNSDYLKSVEKLNRATQSLNAINAPSKARSVADKIERALLDVRRELWKLEQAEKKRGRDPARKNDEQRDSAVAFVKVPILAVPLRFELNWPILSELADPKNQLFFSFRRF
jgi:hypothetical protein